MSSRATVLIDTPTLVLVQVDHGPADSFSRSVAPTATRRWNTSLNRSSATSSVSYEFAVPGLGYGSGEREMCVSFAAFAPSFEAAREAIAVMIESAHKARGTTPAVTTV
jgi:hypothetical protein